MEAWCSLQVEKRENRNRLECPPKLLLSFEIVRAALEGIKIYYFVKKCSLILAEINTLMHIRFQPSQLHFQSTSFCFVQKMVEKQSIQDYNLTNN